LNTLDPLKRDVIPSEQETVRVGEDGYLRDVQEHNRAVRLEDRHHSKVMSEMRRHLVQMNRDKMIERGNISARELAILGKYSNFTDLAIMDFSSETGNTSSSSSSSSTATSRLWKELLY